jgi:hypothetical protein
VKKPTVTGVTRDVGSDVESDVGRPVAAITTVIHWWHVVAGGIRDLRCRLWQRGPAGLQWRQHKQLRQLRGAAGPIQVGARPVPKCDRTRSHRFSIVEFEHVAVHIHTARQRAFRIAATSADRPAAIARVQRGAAGAADGPDLADFHEVMDEFPPRTRGWSHIYAGPYSIVTPSFLHAVLTAASAGLSR